MKILIVGGGVGGLALAAFMKESADVTVVDKAPQWGDIGYGIALWGNGQKILNKLGILHEVLKDSYEVPWNVEEDSKGHVLKVGTFDIFRKFGPTIAITRTSLHMALVKRAQGGIKVKLGSTIKNINQNKKGVQVVFSDDTEDEFDLVVGADGVRSQVREIVFGSQFLKEYGFTIWAFWSPQGRDFPHGTLEMSDAGNIYLIYPMNDRAVVMLATTKQVDGEITKDKLHELFSDFKGSVSAMISSIEDPKHLFKDRLLHVDMQEWFKNRVTLLGDAQHATSPITGMGASLALEDAYVLADELKKNKDLSQALINYSRRRHQRIKDFRKMSGIFESWIMVKSSFLSKVRDRVIKIIPLRYFTSRIEKLLEKEI